MQQQTPINVSLNLNSTDVKLVNQNDRPTCTKFGQSILRKIFIIVATICHLLRLKCTIFDFGRDGKGAIGRKGKGGRRGRVQ